MTGNLPEIATALWAAVSAGGLERAGAYGTEAAARGLGLLWGKIRADRREKGHPEVPGSREELYLSLLALLAEDQEARSLAGQIRAEQVVTNTFHSQVTVHGGTIGINNGPEG
ncbi:hypothetical protein ACWEN6_06405 [Sphaerisporangium sp. NPDC004334]